MLEILQYVIWAGKRLTAVIAYRGRRTLLSYVTAFSCLRVYALQSGRWKVAALVLLLSLVPVAVYSVSISLAHCRVGGAWHLHAVTTDSRRIVARLY